MANIPHLTFYWDKSSPLNQVNLKEGVFCQGEGFVVSFKGFAPLPFVSENLSKSVIVVGSPIFNNKVSLEKVAENALLADDLKEFALSLNGQFLVIILNRKTSSICLINDRFNGVPLYWSEVEDAFYASYLYSDLFKVIRYKCGFKLLQESMLQFLWLNRLLHDKTYDNFSRFLLPSSILSITESEASISTYWRPSFKKLNHQSISDIGSRYVQLLRQAVARMTSDSSSLRYGLFLSGGHDSRSVLAAFPFPPECLTVAFSDNYEVACARKAAFAINARHYFIHLNENHILENLDSSVILCGGMYSFLDALFIGLNKEVNSVSDVVLHGHGLDYMFQGMYLPARYIKFLGSPTFFRRFKRFKRDIVNQYLYEIPYRVKGVDIPFFFKENKYDSAMNSLRSEVQNIIDLGADICNSSFDKWEYLLIHTLGRHYSYPNISSKHSCAIQRTPCFDNDIYNFYLSLPPELRINGSMMSYALNKMNPKLGRIPTGNWGLPAGASPFVKTVLLVLRKVLRMLTSNQKFMAPKASDRTWPDRETYFLNNQQLIKYAREALYSPLLEETITYFDWPRLRLQGESWLKGEKGGAAFLIALITLHRFLLLTD